MPTKYFLAACRKSTNGNAYTLTHKYRTKNLGSILFFCKSGATYSTVQVPSFIYNQSQPRRVPYSQPPGVCRRRRYQLRSFSRLYTGSTVCIPARRFLCRLGRVYYGSAVSIPARPSIYRLGRLYSDSAVSTSALPSTPSAARCSSRAYARANLPGQIAVLTRPTMLAKSS